MPTRAQLDRRWKLPVKPYSTRNLPIVLRNRIDRLLRLRRDREGPTKEELIAELIAYALPHFEAEYGIKEKILTWDDLVEKKPMGISDDDEEVVETGDSGEYEFDELNYLREEVKNLKEALRKYGLLP